MQALHTHARPCTQDGSSEEPETRALAFGSAHAAQGGGPSEDGGEGSEGDAAAAGGSGSGEEAGGAGGSSSSSEDEVEEEDEEVAAARREAATRKAALAQGRRVKQEVGWCARAHGRDQWHGTCRLLRTMRTLQADAHTPFTRPA